MTATALRLCLALGLLFAAAPAAALTQPGSSIPIPRGNNLVNFLNAEGESIDPLTQAAITPQTFNPHCTLTFTVIGRGGGQRNSFGWYNVTGQKPARSDLHEFLACDDDVGTVKTLDIVDHPAYLGGEIAFFQATTQTRHADGSPGGGTMTGNCVKFEEGVGPDDSTLGYIYYSEPQWNDDNVEGEDSTIHLLIMDSGVYPQAFYFGWEDLYIGGDDDFEDLLTRVQGLTCSGGGGACNTDQQGICNAGTMQCRDGELTCVASMQPREEVCNGLDDDCDGVVDNGALCPGGEICHRGACVPKCFPGEFACRGDLICDDGVCVESSCDGVRCEGGAICVHGECKAPCDDVVCPLGETCREGLCVDPCSGVSCEEGQLCDRGVCKEPCGCTPCPDGLECSSSGLCVEAGCREVSCEAGTVCAAGQCVDPCDGAHCPEGMRCTEGSCVEWSEGSAGTGGGGGAGRGGANGEAGSGAGGGGASGGAGGGAGTATGQKPGGDTEGGGCSCAAADGGLGLGLLTLVLLRRRTTRRTG